MGQHGLERLGRQRSEADEQAGGRRSFGEVARCCSGFESAASTLLGVEAIGRSLFLRVKMLWGRLEGISQFRVPGVFRRIDRMRGSFGGGFVADERRVGAAPPVAGCSSSQKNE